MDGLVKYESYELTIFKGFGNDVSLEESGIFHTRIFRTIEEQSQLIVLTMN